MLSNRFHHFNLPLFPRKRNASKGAGMRSPKGHEPLTSGNKKMVCWWDVTGRGLFQVAYSMHPGARKRTKSAMTDRMVDLRFLLSQDQRQAFLAWHSRSRYHKSVDVPVTYLGIAGRQASLPRMRLRNGGEVRSGFAGCPRFDGKGSLPFAMRS